MSRVVVIAVSIAVLFGVLLTGCPREGTATLRIQNDSSFPITEVSMRPSSESEALYGDNLLAEEIQPGEVYDITGIEPGTYDFKAAINTIIDNEFVLGFAFAHGIVMYGGRILTWQLTEEKSNYNDIIVSEVIIQ